MRVTSDTAFAAAVIATITSTAATVLATGCEGTTPGGEGRATTTLLSPPLVMAHCKVCLHSSYMEVGAMLSPISI